jgi:hypothetical protein
MIIMRIKRSAMLAAAGAALMVGGLGTAAWAVTGTASLSTSNVSATGGVVTVNYSGWSPNTIVWIGQCDHDGNANPPFNSSSDCSSFKSVNGTTSASGSGSMSFTAWTGDDPVNGSWACGTSDSGTLTPLSTCYIRVADATRASADDIFLPVTFTAVTLPPDVPEVPLNVLLPASAAALFGAGLLITRKRQQKAAA